MKLKSKTIFLLFFSTFLFFFGCDNINKKDEIKENIKEVQKVDSTLTVSFSAVGDIMCHSTQYNYAWVKKDSFNFNPIFSVIGDYLRSKDILIGNLETVLAGETKKYYGYPFFNSPNQLAEALKKAGFDFLSTANNHSNDQSYAGVKRTLEVLKKNNIIPVGTKLIDSVATPKVHNKKGLKFGLLTYTYGTNFHKKEDEPRSYVNHINYKKIKNDINSLKEKNADLIIVFYHFGKEYERTTNSFQRKVVDAAISYGVDIILGSHPHVVQGFEKFKTVNANLDTGLVIFSLGNFISNQRWRYSDGSLIFNFNITKNIFTDSIYVSDVNYLPIWVFKSGKEVKDKEYIILPSENPDTNKYPYLTSADVDSMKRSYNDTKQLVNSQSYFIKEDNFEK